MNSPELSAAGFEVVDSPFSVATPCINLGEFEDEASPLQETFCGQMTEQQFEAQGASETEKALLDLVKYLEKNPDVMMKILRRRKQEELESSGLLPMLKVRLMSRLQGENYKKKLISNEQCQDKTSELTQGMMMVYNYAQEAKGQRFSKRLASKKRRLAVADENTTPIKAPSEVEEPANYENKPLQELPVAPPPPPLPLPGVGCLGMKRFPSLVGRGSSMKKVAPAPPPLPPPVLTPLRENNCVLNSPTIEDLKRPPLRNGSAGSLVSVHEELLSSNPLQRLKATKTNRSPGGTPTKKGRFNSSTDTIDFSTPCALKNQEPLAQVFLRILEQKFKNIRSPSPAPSPTANISAFSPGDFSP